MKNKNYISVPLKRGWSERMEELYSLINPYGGYICGGFARWTASPLEGFDLITPDDIDVYSTSPIMTGKLLNTLYNQYGSWPGRAYLRRRKVYPDPTIKGDGFINDFNFKSRKLQVMGPAYGGSVVEVLDSFDFTIVKAAILDPTTVLVHKDFLEDEENKRLVLTRDVPPRNLVARTLKYIHRGYKLETQEDMLAILESESALTEWELRYVFAYAYKNHLLTGGLFGPDDFEKLYQDYMKRTGKSST